MLRSRGGLLATSLLKRNLIFPQQSVAQRRGLVQSRRLDSLNLTSSSAANCVNNFVVWDSRSKSLKPLKSTYPHFLSWYACGPTVYDSAHLGHASSYIRQDVIRRILESLGGVTVVQLMGVTNIDDKIIHKANQTGKSWESVSRTYDVEFFEDLTRLNIKHPHIQTRVTDFIPQIIQFVEVLVNKGLAYPSSDGSVYFDTQKFSNYGKFRAFDEESDVEEDENVGKINQRDFAVWKGWKPGEPFWITPWGKGRPGWHIECSVMASHFFGSYLDVHTGGIDLMFPHHENEEAQCCARFGVDNWVTHWMHFGHLKMKGSVKMSKSLGNTVSIQSFLKESSPDVLRMFCIASKYQSGLEFSDESLNHAKALLRKFTCFLSDCDAILKGRKAIEMQESSKQLRTLLNSASIEIKSCLTKDFDTPGAIHVVSHLIDSFNRNFKLQSGQNDALSSYDVDYGLVLGFKVLVQEFLSLVGISDKAVDQSTAENSFNNTNVVVNELAEFRTQVRNYALAFAETDKKLRQSKIAERKELIDACDDLRLRLKDLGVDIKDFGKQSSVSISSIKIT